jgi:8-oxo-dGTP pyrophosphatase MutT (NUDIX family)
MNPKKFIKHRETARIMLVDEDLSIFLLKTHFDPEVGLPPRWLIPGGGIDLGETDLEAAVRELREETGLIVNQTELGEPVLVRSGRWDWADGMSYHTYKDTIFMLNVKNFEPDVSGFTDAELRDILEYRWWNISDLVESTESVAPHGLKEFLRSWKNDQ